MLIEKLLTDIDLYPNDILALASSAQLEQFFERLGYQRTSVELDPVQLGLTELLQIQVRSRRLIATGRDADNDIQIVLLEMRSLAMNHTQAIVQGLRQKPGNYLLILTVDYSVFDFVLLERTRSESAGSANAARYLIYPRVLTVHRDKPGPVVLRVLKRLTYTEMDDLAQWDKLRSAYSLAEWSEPDFNNRALFSDYYLKHRLTDPDFHPIWKDDVRGIGGTIKALIGGASSRYIRKPDAVLRAELIEPLWRAMGFAFTHNGKHEYTLSEPGKPDKPLALALTYPWNRNLDAQESTDPKESRDLETPAEIPGASIVTALKEAKVPWVILTNGKLWRLYSTTAANKITNYYEVDLVEAIYATDHDPVAAFKYWWLIFRRAAFSDGLLDKIVTESQAYARQIGKQLKDRIFEEIFGYFAGGFVDHMRTQAQLQNQPPPAIDLELTYHATMTFLYRLMFILYAESRELLPIKQESGYAPHSLKKLKEMIAEQAGSTESAAHKKLMDAYQNDSTALYERIRKLYDAIDRGDPALNLPVYNGGLFSSETPEGAFLEQHAIPDAYLAIGLDRLARDIDAKTGALAFIDYKSLGVRELGSIYEGLLEFKLRIAADDLTIVRDGKREIYLTRAEAAAKGEKRPVIGKVAKDKVYIENTKKERKATGSYYTPDYIVNYIVEHTVGPVLDAQFATLSGRLHTARRRYRQHCAEVEGRKDSQSAELFWTTDKDAITLADDCLNIRVLDPAMGSGHFLVAAVDYISNRLIDFLNAWTDNPVWALLERTRADILTDLQARNVSVDESKLTRVVLLKRSVLKRCVYGVDLNRMAVELAKVSLWLDAFTLGAPLSFLDHHLKHGNSLIGARVGEVRDAVEGKQNEKIQTTYFTGSAFEGLKRAVETMREISYLPDNTITQVRQSKRSFGSASDLLDPLKRVLDVYLSRWFGNVSIKKGRKADVFEPTIEFLRRKDTEAWLNNPKAALPKSDYMDIAQIASTAQRAADEKSFFHWELEFPEVFFAPTTHAGQDVQVDPNGGFDAVIGNPPYVRIQTLDKADANYFNERYISPQGSYDIYILFVEAAAGFLALRGLQGFICPNKFMVNSAGAKLRKFLKDGNRIESIVDFGDAQIFQDAQTYCCLLFNKSASKASKSVSVYNASSNPNRIDLWEKAIVPTNSFGDDAWNLEQPSSQLLKTLTLRAGRVLGDIAHPHYCLFTGLNEAFVVSSEQVKQHNIEPNILKPLLRGQDVKRWEADHDRLYIIYPYQRDNGKLVAVQIEKYPNAMKYLSNFRDALINRIKFVQKISNSVQRQARWYEYIDPRTPEQFDGIKILTPEISSKCAFVVDTDSYYCLNKAYAVNIDPQQINPYYLTGILNSSVSFYYVKSTATKLANGFYEFITTHLKPIPVPKIDFTTPAPRRAELAAEARTLAAQPDPAPLLTFTAARLSAGESDVIHDLLAALAEQMIDLNKRKQSEVKRFLTWLESQLQIRPDKDGAIGIDSLKKKSFIRDYLGDYQKGAPALSFDDPAHKMTLWYALMDNRTRVAATLPTLKPLLRDEYDKSLAALLPIKAALSRTDALIDRVVYQLYGLTDEEIRLIEYPGLSEAAGSARTEVLREPDIAQQPDPIVADKIVEKIEPAAAQYFARVDESGIEAQLRIEITSWDTLPPNVKKYLRTGETLLIRNNIEDYSGVMIYYAKAVELLLMARWFDPFKAAHSESDVFNEQAFKPYMRGEKSLTLGNVPFLLSSKELAFRAFLARAYPPDRYAAIIDSKTGFASVLTPETVARFRNGSAHTDDQAEPDAQAARAWALRVIGYV